MTSAEERALEHAWRYFSLHAGQRTTVFNFFAAAAGLALSGLAYVSATTTIRSEFGLVAGLGTILLSFVFWKLDQRVAQLTKHSEKILVEQEEQAFPNGQRVFAQADKLPVNISMLPFSGTWSYGRSFRLLFATVAALGLLGAALNGYRLVIDTKSKAQQEGKPAQQPALKHTDSNQNGSLKLSTRPGSKASSTAPDSSRKADAGH